MSESIELAIIGAGPGGYTAAFLAADLGMNVTIIDRREELGGVCLHEGCIPSKAYLNAASLLLKVKQSKKMGLSFGQPKVNIARLRQWKQDVLKQLATGLTQLNDKRKIRYIRGEAVFLDSHHLQIETEASKEKLRFTHIIIATGSSPYRLPNLEKSQLIMSSTEALELASIPQKLLVVGGGYIGLEMGTVYASLGSQVVIVEMRQQLLPEIDFDLVQPLTHSLENIMQKIYLHTKMMEALIDDNGKVKVKLQQISNGNIIEDSFDKLLISIGRRPNTTELGLENTTITTREQGFIPVDGQRRSAEPHIYAIGDVTGVPLLAHKAMHEAKVAIEAISGQNSIFAPHAIPAIVFTEPEIAYCGIMETEAREKSYDIQVSRFPWSGSGRALSLGAAEGLTKMITDTKSGRLLGIGIVGSNAGELIAEGVLSLEMGALAKDLALSIHPHPTLSETLMECGETLSAHRTHVQ